MNLTYLLSENPCYSARTNSIYSSYVMCRPPMVLRCGVSNWQSIITPPFASIICAKPINANFDALGTNENMLSPKKQRPNVTPYSPPTRLFYLSHTSTLAAKP